MPEMTSRVSVTIAQVKKHAQTMLDVRTHIFGLLGKEVFEDEYLCSVVPDEAARKCALMPIAWGAEAAVIPLGLLGDTVVELEKKAGYSRARAYLVGDRDLSRFSVDVLRNRKEERETFAKLLSLAYEPLARSLMDPGSGLAPYGTRDVMDLHTWRLAALVDLDDIFFMRAAAGIDPEAAAKDASLHELFVKQLGQSLIRLRQITKLKLPEKLHLRGWYSDSRAMEVLGAFSVSEEDTRAFKEKVGFVTWDEGNVERWEQFIADFLRQKPIVDTTIVSTRAVLSALSVAKAVYSEAEGTQAQGIVESAATRSVRDAFENIENFVFRNDNFAKFLLESYDKVTRDEIVSPADFDTFIHLTGILAFALTHGYFSPATERESFRKTIGLEAFPDRRAVIARLLKHLRGSTRGLLLSEEGFLDQPNWFVATPHLEVLYNDDGTFKDLSDPEMRRALGPEHCFQFVLGLPLVVKALAELAYQERLYQVTEKEKDSTKWRNISWPGWLDDVEKQASDLAEIMVARMVVGDSKKGRCGTFGGMTDLSVTAAVVDALSLWVAALICKAAVTNEFPEENEEALPDPPEKPLTEEDQRVVADFFGLLKRYTQGAAPGEGTGPTLGDQGGEPAENSAFLDVLVRCMEGLFIYFRPDYNWEGDGRGWVPPDFKQLIQVAAFIIYLRRGASEDARAGIVEEVLGGLRDATRDGKVTEFEDAFTVVKRKMKARYPGAFVTTPSKS